MNKKVLYFGFATLVYLTGKAQQQQDTTAIQLLDEVVVSDSRFPLKREQSGKTIIKISSEELLRNQGRSIAEIITVKSGLEVNGSRSRQGEIQGVFARGGRGRQVLILLDGVRISDPSSFSQEYDLRLLSTANIASIEIIKGAASTLYGSNAATAVISITTKKASETRMSGEFLSSFGTNQTAGDQNNKLLESTQSALLSGTLQKISYGLSVSNNFADGMSSIITQDNEEDVYSNTSLNMHLRYAISENSYLKIYGNQTTLKTEYDESFGLSDAPYRFLSEQKRIGFSTGFDYSNNGSLRLNMAYTDYHSENISAFPNLFSGNNLVLDVFNKLVFDKRCYSIIGLNYIKDRSDFSEVEDFTMTDPYLNTVYVSDFGLNVNSGVRLNVHSEYGNHLVFNVNPSYIISGEKEYFKFLATYATSYITPSLTQLFGDFGANDALEPETNRTIEGGVEYVTAAQLRASVVYFNRKEQNAVIFDNNNFKYFNAENEIDIQGAEIELNWEPVEGLQWTTNYTFTERRGDSAIRIPKHKFNTGLSYQFSSRTFASVQYAFTGSRRDTDFDTLTDIDLKSYGLVACYLSQEVISKKLKVFLNIDNLFNSSFTEVIGFNTRGRNFRFGLNLSL